MGRPSKRTRSGRDGSYACSCTARRGRKLIEYSEQAFSRCSTVSVSSTDKENVTNEFTAKSREQIAGVLSGFDRLVLRGSLRRLDYGIWDAERKAMRARGMEQYLWQNGILHK